MPEFKGRLITPRLSAAPATPSTGEMYYDTGLNQLLYWNGSAWSSTSSGDTLKVDKDSVVVAATRIVANKLLAGDAQPAFKIDGNGTIRWGVGGATAVDTFLSREAAGYLRTGGGFLVDGAAYAGFAAPATQQVMTGNVGPSSAAAVYFGGDTALYRSATGILKTDGSIYAGLSFQARPGAGASVEIGQSSTNANIIFGGDTTLYRNAANVLATGGAFTAAGNLTVLLASGDTQPQFGAFRNYNGSGQPGIAFGPGGTTSPDTALYRSAANTLRTDGGVIVGGSFNASWSGTAWCLTADATGFYSPRVKMPYNGAGGDLVFGGDTNLYRSAAGVLKTDGQIYTGSYVAAFQGGASQVTLIPADVQSDGGATNVVWAQGATGKYRLYAGYVTGTTDASGAYTISYGRTFTNILSVQVTNVGTGELSVIWSASNPTATGFTLRGWTADNISIGAHGFAIYWMAFGY